MSGGGFSGRSTPSTPRPGADPAKALRPSSAHFGQPADAPATPDFILVGDSPSGATRSRPRRNLRRGLRLDPSPAARRARRAAERIGWRRTTEPRSRPLTAPVGSCAEGKRAVADLITSQWAAGVWPGRADPHEPHPPAAHPATNRYVLQVLVGCRSQVGPGTCSRCTSVESRTSGFL